MTMSFKKNKIDRLFLNKIVCLSFDAKTFFDNDFILHTFIVTRIMKIFVFLEERNKNSSWKILTRFYDFATRVFSCAIWCRKSEKLIESRINHDAISHFALNWFERIIWIFWDKQLRKKNSFYHFIRSKSWKHDINVCY